MSSLNITIIFLLVHVTLAAGSEKDSHHKTVTNEKVSLTGENLEDYILKLGNDVENLKTEMKNLRNMNSLLSEQNRHLTQMVNNLQLSYTNLKQETRKCFEDRKNKHVLFVEDESNAKEGSEKSMDTNQSEIITSNDVEDQQITYSEEEVKSMKPHMNDRDVWKTLKKHNEQILHLSSIVESHTTMDREGKICLNLLPIYPFIHVHFFTLRLFFVFFIMNILGVNQDYNDMCYTRI